MFAVPIVEPVIMAPRVAAPVYVTVRTPPVIAVPSILGVRVMLAPVAVPTAVTIASTRATWPVSPGMNRATTELVSAVDNETGMQTGIPRAALILPWRTLIADELLLTVVLSIGLASPT